MNSNLTIYSSPTCPKCKMIKTKLDSAGIVYNVCEDVPTMQKLGIMSLPALGMLSEGSEEPSIIKDFTQINATVNALIKGVTPVATSMSCATCTVPTSKN